MDVIRALKTESSSFGFFRPRSVRHLADGIKVIRQAPFLFRQVFGLWEVEVATGHKLFVLTDPDKRIRTTDRLTIEPLDQETVEYIKSEDPELPFGVLKLLATRLGLELGKKDNELSPSEIRSFIYNNLDRLGLFKISSVLKYKSILDAKGFVEGYIWGSVDLDPRIITLAKISFVHKSRFDGRLQVFTPHMLVVSNTSTGKTTTLERAGALRLDSGSTYGLAGGATSDSVRQGLLDGFHGSVLLDDFSLKNFEPDILNGLQSLMRTGVFRRSKGKREVVAESNASLILTSNPTATTPQEHLLAFEEILTKIAGQNIQQAAGRISVFVFDNNMKTAELKLFSISDELDEAIVSEIGEKLSKKFDDLLNSEDVLQFLSERGEKFEEYFSFCKSTAERVHNRAVRTFIIHQPASWPSMKGAALRLAVFELMNSVLDGTASPDEILSLADIYLDTIISLNQRSILELIDTSNDDLRYLRISFESLPLNKKLLLRLIAEAWEKTGRPKAIPLDQVLSFWQPNMATGRYQSPASLKEKIVRNRTLSESLSAFGLTAIPRKDGLLFRIFDTPLFENFSTIIRGLNNYDTLISFIRESGGEVKISEITLRFGDSATDLVERLRTEGLIYEPKPGLIKLLGWSNE